MSLAEVTSKCFQNGISAQKWADMCQLWKDRIIFANGYASKCELSNSILTLFAQYPADMLLYSYIKCALHNHGLLSLPALTATFVSATKNLNDAPTLDMLCRLIGEEHYSSGLSPEQSLIGDHENSTARALELAIGSLQLLRAAYTLPTSPFHDLVSSASQFVVLLMSCVGNMASISTSQAMLYYAEVLEILQSFQLAGEIRTVLESFALSLNMVLGDDARMAQEAQLMHTLQLSGKGDILGPNSQSDIITCSLLLRHLVQRRALMTGSGNSSLAIAQIVTTYRWTSWSPKTFYTQLFLAALNIMVQANANQKDAFLWRSFIVTRLTNLLADFEQILSTEHVTDSDWRGAFQSAIIAMQSRADLLSQCDSSPTAKSLEEMNVNTTEDNNSVSPLSLAFLPLFLRYCVHRTNLIDRKTAMVISPLIDLTLNTFLGKDCQDSGLTLEAFIDSKLSTESDNEEHLQSFFQRAFDDVVNHPILALAIQKRICNIGSVENLGTLCRVLTVHGQVLDIVSLHVNLTKILSHILAFVEDFDCESVGDPQAALAHLGGVILLLQTALMKYQLSGHIFIIGDRVLPAEYLLLTSTNSNSGELSCDNVRAVWTKALFDPGSEGIEDNIIRTTKPKVLMKVAVLLIVSACNLCSDGKLDVEILNNGVSYFTGPLLNWTLFGVIKALLRDIVEKDFKASVQLDVLQTIVQSPFLPHAVMRLTAYGILALVDDPKARALEQSGQLPTFNSGALRRIASEVLGLPNDGAPTIVAEPLALSPQTSWLDQPRIILLDTIAFSRAGKAPAFDVGRCIAVCRPTRFLRLMWEELEAVAKLGNIELGRRLATHALLVPPDPIGAGGARTVPLLPVFCGSTIHTLLARLDTQSPTEQRLSTELLVAIIASALTGLLHLEWALRAIAADVQGERHFGLQPSVTVARRLAADLKRSTSPTASVILQRLASSPSFIANFPMMAA